MNLTVQPNVSNGIAVSGGFNPIGIARWPLDDFRLIALAMAMFAMIAVNIYSILHTRRLLKSSDATLADAQGVADAASRAGITRRPKVLTDEQIIEKLLAQGFEQPRPTPKDGRCLFHSIALQLTEEDFAIAKIDPTASEIDKANRLRNLAMEMGDRFFDEISRTSIDDIKEETLVRLDEFYKDILEENGETKENIRARSRTTSKEDKYKFFLENYQEYKAKTSRETNWAGTSEAISLACLFDRGVIFYGQDFASRENVGLSAEGYVKPYFAFKSYLCSRPIIRIFQRGGGGHYEYLPRKAV